MTIDPPDGYIQPRPPPIALLFVRDPVLKSRKRTIRYLRTEIAAGLLVWAAWVALALVVVIAGVPFAGPGGVPVILALAALGWLSPAFRGYQLWKARNGRKP